MSGFAMGQDFSLFGRDVPTLLYSDPKQGGDGSVSLNPGKSLVKWNWIAATLNGTTSFSVSANARIKADLTIGASSGQGDFEASTLLWNSTGRASVQIYVNTGVVNRYLSNDLVSDRLVFGTSQLPGVLPQSIYCLPKTFWKFDIQDRSGSTNTVTPVVFGRRFLDRQDTRVRRADFLTHMHPYWIVPQDSNNASLSGDQVTLAANGTAILTFPIPSSADFLCKWLLDDSTNAGATEPDLYAQVTEGYTGRGLVDLPLRTISTSTMLGIHWRDFLACPTSLAVTGFPQGGFIRAIGLGAPRGGFTHLIPRGSFVSIKFTSLDSGAITLRPALFGWLVYGKEPSDRKFTADYDAEIEREAQGAAIRRQFSMGRR